MMRAVVCRNYGPPQDLVVENVADPIPGPGQLLVRVRAAAVNFPDVLLIAGKYQVRVPVPFTPGSELAGDVVAVGVGPPFHRGDRVFGSVLTGAFASWECWMRSRRRRYRTAWTSPQPRHSG